MNILSAGYTYEKHLLSRFVEFVSQHSSSVFLNVYTNKLSCAISKEIYSRIQTAYTYYFDCICPRNFNLFGLRYQVDFSVAVSNNFVLITRNRDFFLSNRKAFYTIYEMTDEEIFYIVERFENIKTEKPILKKL